MKKIIYRDAFNIQTEANVYTVEEYVSEYSPSSAFKPVLTGADGRIDGSLIPGNPGDVTAAMVTSKRLASEPVEEGDVVVIDVGNTVKPGSYNSTLADSMAIGVALNGGNQGDLIEFAVQGIVTKSIYAGFDASRVLYLEESGALTDERPTTGYMTPVAKSLGSGEIQVQIGYPTKLGGP